MKYKKILNNIDEGFCIIQVLFDKNNQPRDYLFLETNPSFENQTGIRDAQGKKMRQIAPELEDHWFEIYGQVALTGEPVRFEGGAQALNRYFDVYAFPIDEPEKRKVAVLFTDITERKRREKKLRENEERLRTALDIDTVGIVFWGADFTITETNKAFLRMSGFNYSEAIGKKWQELTPEEFHPVSEQAIADINETGHAKAFEKQYYRKNGSRWWGLFAPRRINENEVVEYVIDITDRKHREEREHFLLKLNDTLRPLFDPNKIQKAALRLLQEYLGADRVLYIESDDNQFVIKNDATKDVSSMIGELTLSDFGSSLVNQLREGKTYIVNDITQDPELGKKEKKNYQQIGVGSKIAVPLVKDNEIVIILAVHQSQPREWSKQEVALVEETAERTWAYVARSRAEEKLLALKENLEDRVQERTAALKSYRDQLRSLASRLNKAEQKEQHRLATELHDNLGQLLTLGKMKIQNLKKSDLPPSSTDPIHSLEELIDEALHYTRELMTDLKPPPSLDKGDIVEILEWITQKMEKHNLEVAIHSDGQPKPLSEEVQTTLHQSVKELLFNVVKHAGVNRAKVTVSREKQMIHIRVEDQGRGFSMDGDKPVPTEEGGFGLFNIRERLNFLGGKLEMKSNPGKGTSATLYAPLREVEAQGGIIEQNRRESSSFEPAEPDYYALRKIKILLVDDHEMVRRGLRNLIEEQDDMTILAEASNGKEAVDIAHEKHPDIVVMDVNMPVMDGITATREITSSLPRLKVIGLSLHDRREVARNMRRAGASAYLTKDEAFETLCATIRSEARLINRS